MANITGNQDKVRFMSYADGSVTFEEDPKKAGWSRTIELKILSHTNVFRI